MTVGVHEVETNARGQFRFEDLADRENVVLRASADQYLPLECRSQCRDDSGYAAFGVKPPPIEIVVEAHVDSPHTAEGLDRKEWKKRRVHSMIRCG